MRALQRLLRGSVRLFSVDSDLFFVALGVPEVRAQSVWGERQGIEVPSLGPRPLKPKPYCEC